MAGIRRWQEVALDEIAAEEARFSFSWPHAGQQRRLAEDLARCGVLRPLLCVEDGRGRLLLAAGHRRLRWLQEAGVTAVSVALLHAEGAMEFWDHLLADSLDHRSLNPIEAARYLDLRRAATGETLEQLSRRVFALLGLAPRAGAADDLLWLIRQPERYWEPFADSSRPLHVLRALSRAGEDDARAVLEVTEEARGGVNKFAEVVTWLLECAWREDCGVREWLQQEGLCGRWQTLDELRRAIRARRFPSVVAWEEAFPRAVRAADLPDAVRIQAPRGFEGTGYECRIRFSGLQQLESRLGAVLERLRAGGLAGLREFLE